MLVVVAFGELPALFDVIIYSFCCLCFFSRVSAVDIAFVSLHINFCIDLNPHIAELWKRQGIYYFCFPYRSLYR